MKKTRLVTNYNKKKLSNIAFYIQISMCVHIHSHTHKSIFLTPLSLLSLSLHGV